jgi:hypothetical protein
VFGFAVELALQPNVRDTVKIALAKAFEVEVLDARGLVAARAPGDGLSFVVRSEASQATDADVRAAEAWASARQEILRVRIGPLVDLAEERGREPGIGATDRGEREPGPPCGQGASATNRTHQP